MQKNERFKYNLDFEIAMWNLFGRKEYEGIAASFESHSFTRDCLLRSIKRIRQRLNDIPMDERLTFTTGNILDDLEYQANKISEDSNNDWLLITKLLNLVIHLLGYDRCDGKIHRSVVFFQSLGEEQEDWKFIIGDREYYDNYRLEEKQRIMLVNQLSKNKVPKYQIASLLRISIKRVNQILREIPSIEKEIGKSIPTFE